MDHEQRLAMHVLFWAVLTTVILLTVILVRPVGAEDDCSFGTWSVTRLPIVGLACIVEPFPPRFEEDRT